MSVQYCHKCDTIIDIDFNAEHFDDEVDGCETTKENMRLVEKIYFGGQDILKDLDKILKIR